MAKLEHIGIAVQDLVGVRRLLEELLGIQSYKEEEVVADRVRTDFLDSGCAKIELLEGLDPTSPISKFVEKRGPGLHHIAFEVEDVDAAGARIRDLGYTPIDAAPRAGADGKQILFLHPRETAGILIELCESRRSILQPARTDGRVKLRRAGTTNSLRAAHLHDWESIVSPDELARRLETRLSLLDIEAPTDVGMEELREALGDEPLHLIASGPMARIALEYAAAHGALVRTLALLYPHDLVSGALSKLPTLVLSRDDQRLEAALSLHESLPHSRLAVLPEADLDIAARLVANHIASSSPAPG